MNWQMGLDPGMGFFVAGSAGRICTVYVPPFPSEYAPGRELSSRHWFRKWVTVPVRSAQKNSLLALSGSLNLKLVFVGPTFSASSPIAKPKNGASATVTLSVTVTFTVAVLLVPFTSVMR